MNVSGQSLPEENCPTRLGLEFRSRLGLVLGLGGNQTVAPEKHRLLVRVRVWIRFSFGVGGKFFSGAVVLESMLSNQN